MEPDPFDPVMQELRKMSEDLGKDVKELGEAVLNHSLFPVCTASGKQQSHHYGNGGLARHTLEVIKLCNVNNETYRGSPKFVPVKWIFLAGLFHDVGKIWDYERIDGQWRGAKHKHMIHHITKSAMIWHDAAKKLNVAYDVEYNITHAILAHHGRREWGSPVYPQTRLAWLLHLCDSISARMDDCGNRPNDGS